MEEHRPRTWSSETVSAKRPFTLVRHRHAAGHGFPRHGHVYCECFWVESGTYRHELNGAMTLMSAGDIAFVRPNDWHSGKGHGNQGGVIVNLAFPTAVAAGLATDLGLQWPWSWTSSRQARLPRAHLRRLQNWLQEVQPPHNTKSGLLGLLADLVRMLAHHEHSERHFPLWLDAAIAVFMAGETMPAGVEAFIAAGGRTPEHTAREVRRLTGRSLTNFLNDQRLDRAATRLRWSTEPISQIGENCGMLNMPHFYRCFQRRFGVAPGVFRAQTDCAELTRGRSTHNNDVTVLA